MGKVHFGPGVRGGMQAHRDSNLWTWGDPHGNYGRMESLTHTVFFIPVELVPWMTLALIATHCVDANLLATSIVDAALIGVWETKMPPVIIVLSLP